MAKKKIDYMSSIKKVGVILFLGGFLFAQPVIAAVGAVGWGGITIYELVMKKK